jgi:GTP cyclohydrolase II
MSSREQLLRLGRAEAMIPVTPVPGEVASGFLYFNLSNMPDFVIEGARLIYSRILNLKHTKPIMVLAPEASMNCVVQQLRTRFSVPGMIVSKKPRPGEKQLLCEEYYAVTAVHKNTLYLEADLDLSAYDVVLIDNVCTSGETLKACYRLLNRLRVPVRPLEAIVLFTEGTVRTTISLGPGAPEIPLTSFAHIPLYLLPQYQQAAQYVFESKALVPTKYGALWCFVFRHVVLDKLALMWANARYVTEVEHSTLADAGPASVSFTPQIRIHDQCVTSEVFASVKCDCADQLAMALRLVGHNHAPGAVIYLMQEGRGIGLGNKIKAYNLQETEGLDTVQANRALGLPDDAREYIAVRDILAYMHTERICLLTNNPRKVQECRSLGIDVAEVAPLHVTECAYEPMANYIRAKVQQMGHTIPASVFDAVVFDTAVSDTAVSNAPVSNVPLSETTVSGTIASGNPVPTSSVTPTVATAATAATETTATDSVALWVALRAPLRIQLCTPDDDNDNVVAFYEPYDTNGYLSNFYPAPIRMEDGMWPTTEHWYQSRKTFDMALREQVRALPTAGEAYIVGQRLDVTRFHREHRRQLMFLALQAKFAQHPQLRQQLLDTGDAQIEERSPLDTFWGVGPVSTEGRRTGQNHMGQLLMKLRAILRNREPANK